MSINKLYDSFNKAGADVFDGAVILIGGFYTGSKPLSACTKCL